MSVADGDSQPSILCPLQAELLQVDPVFLRLDIEELLGLASRMIDFEGRDKRLSSVFELHGQRPIVIPNDLREILELLVRILTLRPFHPYGLAAIDWNHTQPNSHVLLSRT